ncbi:MAG: hypothetical protein ACYCS8_00860 [Acidithiobacillus sp.]|uniref:hypothetical protein n=1 Tax=Acidithiobacillus ferrooxidans TaxID=920 RepID=UPI000AD9A066|nr:hypothetical protein [Acidithiobacillus ferrooxidans]
MNEKMVNHRIKTEILRSVMPQVLIPACFIGIAGIIGLAGCSIPKGYLLWWSTGMIVTSLMLFLLFLLMFAGVLILDAADGARRKCL